MQNFGKLFIESKGEPIEYNGTKLHLADKFPVSNGDKLLICIESTNSNHPQGVSVDIEGSCEIQGKLEKKGKWIRPLFWEDTEILDPKHMELTVFTKKDFVWIQNICETEYSYLISDETGAPLEVHKKKTDSGHGGAAMIIEEIENGRRYRCSDISLAERKDPFSDIVFTVQRMKLP
jgi:hypothetical protein